FAKTYNIPEATLRGWKLRSSEFLESKKHGSRATLQGHGRSENIDFSAELVAFMDAVREGEHFLTTAHLVTWIKSHQPDWLASYMAEKANEVRAYKSLVEWCLNFANRHGYKHRVPCPAKVKQGELIATQDEFAAAFQAKFGQMPRRAWMNVDETPVYYDMPPGRTLAKVGHSSRVLETQKNSDRVTAVLSVREKLPLLIIVKGTPGGDIERFEVPTYPAGPVYAVQEKAYMDERVWSMYLREVLKPAIDCPTVVLADNLKCHVSKRSYKIMKKELYCGAYLHPLPANTTSVLQPLDVGVMGPFKQMCRSEWIKETKVVTAQEKRMAMILRAIKVWDAMKEDTISKSFEKALGIFEI
ncbi:hypothetical protein DYB35_013999, partial [Aphanomyces astaci]